MRAFRLGLITVILCAVMSSLFSFNNAFALEGDTALFYDEGGVFVSSFSGNKAIVSEISPNSFRSEYRVPNNIQAMTVYKSEVYILCHSPEQKDVYILTKAKDGRILDELYFRGFTQKGKTCLAVDDRYFYLINANHKADVFNYRREKVYTTSFIVNDMVSCGDTILCNSNKEMYYLSGSSESVAWNSAAKGKLRFFDGDFAVDSKGYAYCLSDNGGCQLKTDGSYEKICGLNGELYVLSGSILRRYSITGELTGETELNDCPDMLAAYKNKLVFIYKKDSGYSFDTKKASALFKNSSAFSSEKSDQTSGLSGYQFDGKYIYLSDTMTISAFKNSVADDYKCEFYGKKSGKIGTGLKVKLSGGSTEKNCTFVLFGDVTGEGNINGNDTNAVFDHLLKNVYLRGAYKKAADINRDNSVTNADLVLVSRRRR